MKSDIKLANITVKRKIYCDFTHFFAVEIENRFITVGNVERRAKSTVKFIDAVCVYIYVKACAACKRKMVHFRYAAHLCRNCNVFTVGFKTHSATRGVAVQTMYSVTHRFGNVFGHSSEFVVFVYKSVNTKR